MKKTTMILIGVVVVVIIAFIAMIGGSYNSLVTMEEKVEKEASNISVQLERRADLIPNLVNTVKGYASHETEVVDKITTARQNLLSAKGVESQSKANDELTSALNALMIVVENYPDLKASSNFIQLSDELAGTENRIATARRDYNEAVTSYNTAIKKFPKKIVASLFGFEQKAYFEAKEDSNQVPSVEF